MRIRGIWAVDAHLLPEEQWVKVWLINHWTASEYYGCCQVKNLASVVTEDAPLSDFGLEPCDANGIVIELEGMEELW
jgi:hypothetical protein